MQNGGKVANLNLATSESWRDKQSGEKKEKTEWHRVVIFGNLAEIAEKYLKKGSKVYVCGSLQTRKWTDQSGQEKYTTEVVLQGYGGELTMLDGRGGGGGGSGSGNDWDSGSSSSGGGSSGSGAPGDMDDEIPF